MNRTFETPRGTILLRSANKEDIPNFRELRLEALRDLPAMFGSDYAANEAQPIAFWEDRIFIDRNDGKVFFAEVDGQLIGMCGIMLGTSPKTHHNGTIWGVYIKPAWQGLHIARALIEECTGWGSEHGCKILKLAVVANNTSAIRCYTACGFSVYGLDPQAICYEGKMIDELLMSKDL